MPKLKIKPLSVNKAFKGRRFKTKEYDKYIYDMLMILPNSVEITNGVSLSVSFVFGYSSRNSDIDNALKCTIDCLVKKYGFDDRYIYELYVRKEIVPKGKEYIEFNIKEIA